MYAPIKTSIEVQLTELLSLDHVTTVGVPAWTEVGTLVKATFWARADTTKVRPRTIVFEKSIFVCICRIERGVN